MLPRFYTLPSTKEGVPHKRQQSKRPPSPQSLVSEERRTLTAFCDRHLQVGRWEKLVCDCTTRSAQLDESGDSAELASCFEDRACAWGHLGKWDRVVADCSYALDITGPNNPRLLAERGNAYCMINEWHAAISDCTASIKVSGNIHRDRNLARCFCASVFGNRSVALRMIGFYEKSVEDCTRASNLDPTKNIYHLRNRFLSNRALGRWKLVINDLDLLIRLDPTNEQLWITRGVSLGKLEDPQRLKDAKISFDAALHLDPNNPSALLNRGVANGVLGLWQESIHDCLRALSYDSKNVMGWRTLGYARSQLGYFQQAVEDFTTAFDIAQTASLLLNRATANGRLGNWKDVITDTSVILDGESSSNESTLQVRNEPDNRGGGGGGGHNETDIIMALNQRVSARRALKQFDDALKDCEKLFMLIDGHNQEAQVSALASRALVYSEMKQWDSAVGDCDAAFLLASPLGNKALENSEEEVATNKKASTTPKDQNLAKLARLREWVISKKQEDLKEASEKADRMARLLIAEENSNVWSEAYTTTVSSTKNLKKKQRKLKKKSLKTRQEANGVVGANTENAKDEDERDGSDKKENENQVVSDIESSSCVIKLQEVSAEDVHAPSPPPSPPPPPQTPQTPERKTKIEASPRSVYEKFFRSVRILEKTLTDATKRNAKESAKSSAFASSSMKEQSSTLRTPTIPEDKEIVNEIITSSEISNDSESSSTNDLSPRQLFSESASQVSSSQTSEPAEDRSQDLVEVKEVKASKTTLLSASPLALEQQCDKKNGNNVGSNVGIKDVDVGVVNSQVDVVGCGGGGSLDLKCIGKLSWFEKDVLGQGSFGTVVMSGQHREWGGIAVKCMLKGQHHKDPEQGRVLDLSAAAERDIMRLMSRTSAHENVVRYFGVEEDETHIYLAIEKCAYSLHDLCFEKSSDLSNQRSLLKLNKMKVKLVSELLRALEFLHSKGVVHGDLRPRNVLFTDEGVLKLSDFGLARQVSNEDEDASFTWAHAGPTGMGGWFAPEVYRKQRKTKAVDIFSAGCVIYFALTNGHHPFRANAFDVVAKRSSFEHLHDFEAIALVKQMVAHQSTSRPPIATIMSHPYLWPSHKRLAYLEEVGNKLDRLKSRIESVKLQPSKSSNTTPVDWTLCIDQRLYRSLTRFRSYSSSTPDLIRFIRNLDQHFTDQEVDAVRVLMATLPNVKKHEEAKVLNSTALQRDAIEAYFFTLFPCLIIELWGVLGSEF